MKKLLLFIIVLLFAPNSNAQNWLTQAITKIPRTIFKFSDALRFFVVNDTFEFQNEDNRRVIFSETDTTFYKAKFNKR